MAKTIYEMAVEYSKIDLPNGKEGTNKFEKDAYIEGANAMLDELRTRLQKYRAEPMGEYFVAWDYINEVINELKGK